jgi:glucose-1-phosphate cytidylyltransferase
MKVAILAGGHGSRLAEETEIKPKPMVEIGGRPILWHIMKSYAHFGCREFFIALGYKGEIIKRFFMDYYGLNGNMSIQLSSGQVERHGARCEDWLVHLIDTGLETQTGGRLKRLEPYLREATFMLTYGDGVSNIDLSALLAFHRSHGCLATVTAVRPPARFGGLVFDGDLAVSFSEKPQIGEGWINGGFFVFEPQVFDYIQDDTTNLESVVLPRLAANQQLVAYRHDGFWQCMDTLREVRLLQSLWQDGQRPWKVWEV